MDVSNNETDNTNATIEQNKQFRKMIHDIRNMLKLTQENITYIQSLSDKEKMEIIVEYDKVTQTLVQSLYSHM